MKAIWFALTITALFLLMPYNNVVMAETIEQTKVLYIGSPRDMEYGSSLNILNNTTNQRFTNSELLVKDFTTKTGIDGGFAGSLMPPALFQTNFGKLSNKNDNLILASTVEFQEKNLLSGASESWWRCPYAWNWSISVQRNWYLDLS